MAWASSGPRTPTGPIRRRRRSRRPPRRPSRRTVQADFAGTYADSNALAMALADSAQVRECVARQMFRSRRAAAAPTCPTRPIGTPSTLRGHVHRHLEPAPEREPGEVRRDAGRLRPQPPVRQTEPPVKRSPTRRSFLRAVGAGATALPFYGLLEDSVARAAGETIPLRFAGIYHPHGVAAELFVMQSGDTESNFNLTYVERRPVLAAAVRRRRDLRQELQEQDHRHRGASTSCRTPTGTRRRARS